jgi:hypothetical protein
MFFTDIMHSGVFMKKALIILIIITGISVTGALNFHFILLDNNIKTLKKTRLTFQDTFVDARGKMNKAKLLVKPALIRSGIKDLIK